MPLSSPKSGTFDETLELAPRPSARAVIALFWLHTLPLVLVMASPLDGKAMAALALVIGASWLWLRRHRAFGFGPHALVRLRWPPAGPWALENPAGEAVAGHLAGSSVVVGPVMVLNFTLDGGGRRTRILLGDELDDEVQQRLRARLSARAASPPA